MVALKQRMVRLARRCRRCRVALLLLLPTTNTRPAWRHTALPRAQQCRLHGGRASTCVSVVMTTTATTTTMVPRNPALACKHGVV